MQRETSNNRAGRSARGDGLLHCAGSLRGARAAVGVVVGEPGALGAGRVAGVVATSTRRNDGRKAAPASRAGGYGPAPRQRDRHERRAVVLARGLT